MGTGVVQHVRIGPRTIHVDAPIWMAPVIDDMTKVVRYGHSNIGGMFGAAGGTARTARSGPTAGPW